MQRDAFPRVPPPAPADEDRLDELYEMLSHQRRRSILWDLQESDTGFSIDELAERIARREAKQPTDQPPDDFETVCRSLYHTHLPKLAETGAIEYDTVDRTVEYRWLSGDW